MANGMMFNPAHRPTSRKARARQLLEVIQPTCEWEHRFLEGHAHRLLNLAASEGNWERMHQLLDAGVRVVAIENEADHEQDWTLLHHLVQGEALHGDARDREVLGRLLARPQVKAAIDHRNDDGETALYLALQAPDLDDACATLLEHGATINASQPAEFGPHEGEAKLNEWQLLIDKPWGRPATLHAYIRGQATNAAEAHFCLNSLYTAGLGQSAASLGRVREALAWVEVGMEQFCAHPDNDPALIDKLQNTALGYLRWSTLGDTTLPKDVWIAERGPLAFGMMQAFERGGCQLLSGATPPAMQWCLQHDMAGLAAELERQHLSQATPDALHPGNAAAHRL